MLRAASSLLTVLLPVLIASTASAQLTLTSSPNLAIPDNGGGPACIDTITVPSSGNVIGALRVGLRIDHGNRRELYALLLPPGVSWPSATYTEADIPAAVTAGAVELMSAPTGAGSQTNLGVGASPPYSYVDFTLICDPIFDFDIVAGPFIGGGTNPTGTYLAADQDGFQDLYDTDPSGTWTLVVIDRLQNITGTLISWQLEYDIGPSAYLLRPEVLPIPRVEPGQDRGIAKFFICNAASALLNSITLTYTGQGNASDLTNVNIYEDNGIQGLYEPGIDGQLSGHSVDFTGGNVGSAVVPFPNNRNIGSPGRSLLVVADVIGELGDDFVISIESALDVTAASGAHFSNVWPVVATPVSLVGPARLFAGSTFTQGFESGAPANFRLVDAGYFPQAQGNDSMLLAPAWFPNPSSYGSRVGIYQGTLPDTVSFPPLQGQSQVGFDFPYGSSPRAAAVDLLYDLSALDPLVDDVTVSFWTAGLGAEDGPADIVVLSRDGGTTWESVLFNLPDPRPASYTMYSFDLSPIVAGLPGGNFSDDMIIRIQEADNERYPYDGVVFDSVMVSVSGGGPSLFADGAAVFGLTPMGSPSSGSPAPWTVENVGTGTPDLTITEITMAGPGAADFVLGALPQLPLTLQPGQDADFELSFVPVGPGTRAASVRFLSNSTSGDTLDFPVQGEGDPPLLSKMGATNFGFTRVGTASSPATWELSNYGPSTLIVTDVLTTDPAFTLSGLPSFPLTLTGSQTVDFQLGFSPVNTGVVIAQIQVVSNSGGLPNAVESSNISGIGTTQEPHFAPDHTSFSFVTYRIGDVVDEDLGFRNFGETDLVITDIALVSGDVGEFDITYMPILPLTMPLNDFDYLNIAFDPTSFGQKNAVLRITSNDGGVPATPFDLQLTGELPLPELEVTGPTSFVVPGPGQPDVEQWDVANIGGGDLVVTFAGFVSGDTGVFSATYEASPSSTRTLPGNSVNPNNDVTFDPTTSGQYAATFRFICNDGGVPNTVIDIPVTGVAGPFPPDLELQGATSLTSFGLGQAVSTQWAIDNQGFDDLEVTDVSFVSGALGDFQVVGISFPVTVPAGANTIFDVVFTPSGLNPVSAVLRVTSNDGGVVGTQTDTTIDGILVLPQPPQLDVLGNQNLAASAVGQPVQSVWNVRNLGQNDLIISGASFIGGSAADFSFSGLSFPVTLPQGIAQSFTLTYTPSMSGQRGTVFQFVSNDGGAPGMVTDVPVTGVAPPEPPELDLHGSTSFDASVIGQLITRDWVLRNTGEEDLIVTDASLVGGAAADFSLSGLGLPQTLAEGDSLGFSISFVPSAAVTVATTLRLVSNTGGTPGTEVDRQLTGSVTAGGGGSGGSGGGGGGGCGLRADARHSWAAAALCAVLLLWVRRRGVRHRS